MPKLLEESPYQAYVYSYPHKTAYRPITPPIPLDRLWAKQNRQALFLYIHIPFCEMRCGFCNLFTTVKSDEDFVSQYINTVERQARRVKIALNEASFARFAIGGGTPTQLPLRGLSAILDIAEGIMGDRIQDIPSSVEVSPETVDKDKLKLLRDRGIDRLSIGVQSFIDSEVLAIHRQQKASQVEAALTLMRSANFPTINIDLMYGLPGQTVETCLQSIQEALRFQPEEIYLYPLYVRPLTSMGQSQREWDDIRLACYREGRSLLLSENYTQVSMRMFRAKTADGLVCSKPFRASPDGLVYSKPFRASPVYCCQADGMVGLGCGARSYTDELHYSNEYAVGKKEVRHILEAFIKTPDESFDCASYGFQLDAEDRRRRYILLSLLSEEGFNLGNYRDRFHTDAFIDFPELSDLLPLNLAYIDNTILRLTEIGIERSDAIGPWLFSNKVCQLMQSYDLK